MTAIAIARLGGEGFIELCQESIQVFDFERSKIDAFIFKMLVERGQDPSYGPEVPLGKLFGLLQIE